MWLTVMRLSKNAILILFLNSFIKNKKLYWQIFVKYCIFLNEYSKNPLFEKFIKNQTLKIILAELFEII